MPSKWMRPIISIVLVFISVSALVSCSYFFEEKEKEEQVSYDKRVGTCVGESNQTIKIYFQSEDNTQITEEKIQEAIDCYQESILSFVENTKSGQSQSTGYSAESLFGFFDKFYNEYGLEVERIEGYFQLKSFLLGGHSESVSKKELMALHDALPVVAESLKQMLPHRQIVLQRVSLNRSSEDYDRFQNAFKELKQSLGRILLYLDQYDGQRKIPMDLAAQFLFSEFYGDEASSQAKYLNLIKAFKNFALNRKGGKLRRDDFSFLVRQSTLTYQAIAQFEYFVRQEGDDTIFNNMGHIISFITRIPAQLEDSKLFKTVTLKSLLDIFDGGKEVLTYAIRTRESRHIQFDRLETLLEGLEEAEIMGETLTASTLSLFIEKFSEKWLDPANTRDSKLTLGKVNYVWELMGRWLKRQKIVNSLFHDPGVSEVSFMDLEKPLEGIAALDSWIDILNQVSVHQWDESKRVLYSHNMRNFNYEEMTVSNSIMLLAELFMKPYNLEAAKMHQFEIKEENAQEIYQVLRILGVEMAFMDSRVANSGRRSFMEANNFTTQKRSDEFMDFYESYEFLSVALSSGGMADLIYALIPESCKLPDEFIDVHRSRVVKKDCFERVLAQNYGEIFSHLPVIHRFWTNADDRTRTKFLGSLEYASRAGVITDKHYDLTEIRVLTSVTNYLNSIFYMFDSSRDGIASGDELNVAQRHFHPMIVDFLLKNKEEMLVSKRGFFAAACGKGISDQREAQLISQGRMAEVDTIINNHIASCLAPKLFIHLLNDGRLPSGDFFTDRATQKFIILLDSYSEREAYATTEASPREVLRVFSALAKVSHEGHVARVRKFILENREGLLNNIVEEEAPRCQIINYSDREIQPNVFCQWSRMIYCNDNTDFNQEVYTYFKKNKGSVFPEREYDRDPEDAVNTTLERLSIHFTGNDSFSTFCAFPHFRKPIGDAAAEVLGDAGERVAAPLVGTEEDIGVFDRLNDWWNGSDEEAESEDN